MRWLMESEGPAAEVKERAIAARREGGSSEMAWKVLVSALSKEGN